jgi:Zn-dependent membrane protease YugP
MTGGDAVIGFDMWYVVFIAPAALLAIWAQWRVMSTYRHASQVAPASGLSGAEAAANILAHADLPGVGLEQVEGQLSDHYDPSARVLRLSPDVYHGRSLAALGIAAHEAGHALQHGRGYAPLAIRNAIVPLASWGGNLSWILIVLGVIIHSAGLIWLGIAAFSLTVIFQLVNLPVEFDASNRAMRLLQDLGMVSRSEMPEVRRVLSAAAMTYVAGTLTAVMELAYFIFRAGGGGDDHQSEAA